ncbi:MAG: tRNA (adenosine(37)-N6)-threonylcarbamoyltransferase complex ATPase subunit type 1 TsaE [Gemmatimonadaceae bacterium]|nr:tRNA (adenosine(37)-N6)-threonylcarbamoyltransferase complex ATPase subunit type 1 TsaE [Gemmatimonadaceae bacterium]NUR18153.1 tRNA (adenosine(37)-N6)-threonylcarbamoyltransferase complex ATPase subunit type 1 TsaE [Gemmatimonadaceae bacterium]NUS97169.1 tRNA (adenosine(37)-N6)-threonylcarbamoyltransferase complex ATPase subunit type 1 TsaE [Gemmatimonadaceae bacterium]
MPDHASHPLPPLAARGRLSLTLEEMVAWGERFGRAATPPLVVTLAGDLGAGKTTLVQAICRGYGVTEPVTSPTFALVHRYAARRSPVYHLDLYRLRGPAELTNIGWDEIVSAHALVLVEWPERATGMLPQHVPIDLEHLPGDESRRVLLAG